MHQHFAEQLLRHLQRGPFVERTRENSGAAGATRRQHITVREAGPLRCRRVIAARTRQAIAPHTHARGPSPAPAAARGQCATPRPPPPFPAGRRQQPDRPPRPRRARGR